MVPTWHTFWGCRELSNFLRQLWPVLVTYTLRARYLQLVPAVARRCTCITRMSFRDLRVCKYNYVRVQIFASKLPYVTCISPASVACCPAVDPTCGRSHLPSIPLASDPTYRRSHLRPIPLTVDPTCARSHLWPIPPCYRSHSDSPPDPFALSWARLRRLTVYSPEDSAVNP